MTDPRRSIPSVDRLLSSAAFASLLDTYPREVIRSITRDFIDVLRATLGTTAAGDDAATEIDLAAAVSNRLSQLEAGTLRRVLNATGVVLHTNLGRAPLAAAAIDAIRQAAAGYANLEYDIDSGTRGSRYVHCRDLLVQLTGAEDALVVNNNAAALVLALNTLALGRSAVVSRGELVEIGGSFRVPDIMERSGARLHEVGSTNRTHLDDYADACGADTGVLLKVHPSNFTVAGYVADVTVQQLAGLAASTGVPLIHDIGSGLLIEPTLIGLPADEPTPRASIADGADIVTLSGDKLLGGPQCGIVLGSTVLVERMRRNPLCRALRVDKLTLAALAATLRLYLRPERALRELPALRMLALPLNDIEVRARALAAHCDAAGLAARVVPGSSAVGGGASPAASLPTVLVAVSARDRSASDLERALRHGAYAVITRIVDGDVAFDLRTVDPDDDELLVLALLQATSS
ncbi:L-seryl-tRNA(Sec) selenium transferase [soil metagenome]